MRAHAQEKATFVFGKKWKLGNTDFLVCFSWTNIKAQGNWENIKVVS